MLFKKYLYLREVVVNLKTDKTFRGILYKQTRNFVILKHAQMLLPKDPPIKLDGEVYIEADNIDFIQVVK